MQKVGDYIKKYKLDDRDKRSLSFGTRDKYVSREFQKYGYDLAHELGVPKMVSFYIKLAKETPRKLLEAARTFVKDAQNARSKSRLFVWKVQELKKEGKMKDGS